MKPRWWLKYSIRFQAREWLWGAPGETVDCARSKISHALLVCGCLLFANAAAETVRCADSLPTQEVQALIREYCIDCHSGDAPQANFNLTAMVGVELSKHSGAWERVVRKLRMRQMPPAESARPNEAEYQQMSSSLEQMLDQHMLQHPRPGRTETFRRLTRVEYQRAIRDLLQLDVDVSSLLPADEVSHGFDNITVGELSPSLLNRYLSAAQKISRLALGRVLSSPDGQTVRLPPDLTQEEHIDGLPLGTRGGAIFSYTFPQDGEYEIRLRLTRDRDEHVEGLNEAHELELLVDSERAQQFTVQPPRRDESADGYGGGPTHETVDQHLVARLNVTAGPHSVGVAFLKNPSSLLETKRQPLHVHYNMYRHPRIGPAIFQITIAGPFERQGAGESPSRANILTNRPVTEEGEPEEASEGEACARQIIARLLRRACRQPVSDEDMSKPLELYRQIRAAGGDFESGIELALSAILVNPRFLFRMEADPPGIAPDTPYRVSDVELATRLSFFLWSSIPDDELLELAERGQLSDPQVLEQQTRRMLADERARALVFNFAGQWLYLRNLDSITPDARLYPDFDDNLRQAFRQETELFLESVIDEDRSVLDLLHADYTYLNERLAKHYDIPHVYGSRFRRVDLSGSSQRGGLLRQGSILTVTSYATRTSPVLRGKWILENLLGTPPPPPPPNVPDLSDNVLSAKLSVRERLAQHRADPACASCHRLIDPLGFALENFDAVGRWRETEGDRPVDASGGLADGTKFDGPAGLEQALLDHPEVFVGTLVEKLLTYGLGRGCEPDDAPVVRQVVRTARANDFRFSSLILGIVRSTPFQMRMSR